jgi:hypothetical protein
VRQSQGDAADQFTESGRLAAYHTDRWIVNKVTFYLTFC